MTFYDRLDFCLKLKNMSKSALADALNIRKATMFAWKDGSYPRGDDLIRIANYLGTTAEYLITGVDTIHNDSISAEEKELVSLYRQVSTDEQAIIIKSLKAFILASNFKK